MKVVAYSIEPFEKEHLAIANHKKHDITLISNPLNLETAVYATGKTAVVISERDDVCAAVLEKLFALNIRFIITRSKQTGNFDKIAAVKYRIKLARVLSDLPQEIANQTINNLDLYQLGKCVGDNCTCADSCRIKPLPDNL